jgi:signal transduction histidine kinase
VTARRDPATVMRRWRAGHRPTIRQKLGAAIVIPVVALAVVVVMENAQVTSDADRVRRQSALVAAADGPGGLLRSLQDERNWVAVELIGQAGLVEVDVEGYDETRRRTDEALTGFREFLDGSNDDTRSAYRSALASLDGLAALRARIDAFDEPRTIDNAEFGDEMFEGYTATIEPFLDAVGTIAATVEDRDLRLGAELIATSSAQVEVVANLARRTLVYSLFTDGGVDTPQEIYELSDLRAELNSNVVTLELNTTGPYRSQWDTDLFYVFTWNLAVHSGRAIDTGTVDVEAFLDIVTVPTDRSYFGYRERVGRIARAEAEQREADAARRQWAFLAFWWAIVVLTVAVVWLTTRSIARPLLSLARQTADVAHRQLPAALADVLGTPVGGDVPTPGSAPIRADADTDGQIGKLATVLDKVRGAALDLAVGQAILRRNLADALLLRQLALITELERNEADPAVLTNLFQLDHLATRMRRNAESLLVLGELPPAHTRTGPVGVTDVVRAALGEVEDFRRVEHDLQATGVQGRIAADLAHLLAELIENALLFSAPSEPVQVVGRGSPAAYRIAIIDTGVGMSPRELEVANRRLAGTESFTVAPSKYLGHYVSGHLAGRHGIRIGVGPSPVRGVTVTIELPEAVLVPDPPRPPGPPGHQAANGPGLSSGRCPPAGGSARSRSSESASSTPPTP